MCLPYGPTDVMKVDTLSLQVPWFPNDLLPTLQEVTDLIVLESPTAFFHILPFNAATSRKLFLWKTKNELMNCSVAMLMQNKPKHSFSVTTSVLANFSSGLLQIAHCWQETQHRSDLDRSNRFRVAQFPQEWHHHNHLLDNSTPHAWL